MTWLHNTQQSRHQLFQQDFVSYGHPCELDTKTFCGGNASHDCIGPYVATRYFKRQPEFGAYGRRIWRGDEQSPHAERLDAGKQLKVCAMPAHGHSLRQGNARVSARLATGLLSSTLQGDLLDRRSLSGQAYWEDRPILWRR